VAPARRWLSSCARRQTNSCRLAVGKFLAAAYFFAIVVSFAISAAWASEAAAHGGDHPTALRNAPNQFTILRPQGPAPMTPILAEDGGLLDLGRFRGTAVLLNFWATWCPPCVQELPALDRLQSALAGQGLTVVALSIDEGDIDVPVSFVRRLGLTNLAVYQDFTGAAANAFPLYGLPITYLIDRDGRVIGYIVGAVDWDSAEAVAFLRHYTA
jgi:thiol-disulfide isomerase/thioredoxin